MPLQQSLLARRGSLWAISVVRHPPLRRILRVRACCAVGAVLSLPRGAPLSVRAVSLDATVTHEKGDNITERGLLERQGEHGALRHREELIAKR